MAVKFFLICCLVSFVVNAQRIEHWNEINKEHTSYLGSESASPFVVNQIQIPLNTKPGASFSVLLKSNSGNAFIHQTTLKNKKGGYREIEYDAIIEKDAIYISYPILNKWETFVEIGFISASSEGKINPMNWIVQDSFIENIHKIAGKSDPFKRREKGFNNFSYQSTDENTKVNSLDAEKIFSMPLLAGVNYYFIYSKKNNRILSANANISLKIPLINGSFQQNVETGIGATISKTKLLRKNKGFTSSFHGSIYHHEISKTNNYISGDKKMSYKISGLLGFNFYNKKNGNALSVFSTLNKSSSRFDTKTYKFRGNSLNQQAMEAITEGNEYIELGSNYGFNFKNKDSLRIEITLREDVDLNINEFNKTLWGRNAEDFGVFLGFMYLIR